jgi:putative transposase
VSSNELDFSVGNVSESWMEVNRMLGEDFGEGSRWLYERLLNLVIAADFKSYVGARRYERVESRRGWRNGSRPRRLLTRLGRVDLAIPRIRELNYQPSWLERYQRLESKLAAGLQTMFIQGVSTAKVGNVLEVLCGERVSKSTVSKLALSLEEEVRAYQQRRLDDDFVFLYLDGLSVKIRKELKADRWQLLVAYGIRADGSRELIGFQKYPSESTSCWQTFLENLKMRGLKGRVLQLIILDGSKGLWQAVQAVYPEAETQLCWVHKLRNVANACSDRHRPDCLQEAARIMNATSARAAANRFRNWRQKWQSLVPKAVACLERDFDKLLAIFVFPLSIRQIIRSTNVIERAFREVRRRQRPMGYFTNNASCQRIIYAIFAHLNAKWEQRQYHLKPIKEALLPAA